MVRDDRAPSVFALVMNGNEETIPDQLQALLRTYPDLEVVEAILPDINGNFRGKWLARSKIDKAFRDGIKMPLSTLAFDVWGRDPESWVYDNGDADGICKLDANSLVPVPWMSRTTAQVLLSLNETNGQPCAYDPRAILARLIRQFKQLGLTPVVASEMEFYLLNRECDLHGKPQHTQQSKMSIAAIGGQTYGIETMQEMAEIMHGIRDACSAQHLPIDTLIKEAALSQYEINLDHQSDAMLAADQGLLLKRAIKGVAGKYGMRASFMAKPFADTAGNGMHIHCSLLDEEGNNAFDNNTDTGNGLLRHAVAGCLASMNDCMLLFAPHMNSYRRYQSGSHAPTAPSWGYENRTVAVRIPADKHSNMRIEHRVTGADAHPHLVIAAIIGGMLNGIREKLEPPAPLTGNAYLREDSPLPKTWADAIERFSRSKFIETYFGEEFQRVFTATKRQELEEFNKHITPLEYMSYL